MNTGIFRNKWIQLVGDIRQHWGKPTVEDIDKVNGDAEKLISKLQERYGYARDPGLDLDEFVNSANNQSNSKREQANVASAR